MKRFILGLLTFLVGAALAWLGCNAMQVPALGCPGLVGFVLGLVVMATGGGLALGCEF